MANLYLVFVTWWNILAPWWHKKATPCFRGMSKRAARKSAAIEINK